MSAVKRLYIGWHSFWLRHRLLRLSGRLLTALLSFLCLCLTAGVLAGMVFMESSSDTALPPVSAGNPRQLFEMYMNNRLSDALADLRSVEKVYWLSDEDPVAPEPDAAAFGETDDEAVLNRLLEDAADLLDGQSLYFDPRRERMPESTVRYYLDETILAIAWKEVHNHCVYTFSEVKIAHPSQFRRFLSGGAYGTAQQFLTTEMSKSVNAVTASSGDFYGYRDYGTVVYGGTLYRYDGILDLCLVDEQGDLRFLRAGSIPGREELEQYIRDNAIRFSFAFGPVLVEDGQRVYNRYYPVGEIDEEYSRAALCQMDTLHYLVAAANMEPFYYRVPTLNEFTMRIAETGCRMAYTLDGGQTAAITMNHRLVNQVSYGSQRRISDIFYFATALPDGG